MSCTICAAELPAWFVMPTDPSLRSKSSTLGGVTVYFEQNAEAGTSTLYCSTDCYQKGAEYAATQERVRREGYGNFYLADKDSITYKSKRDKHIWAMSRRSKATGQLDNR